MENEFFAFPVAPPIRRKGVSTMSAAITLHVPAARIRTIVPSTSSADGFARVQFPDPTDGLTPESLAAFLPGKGDAVRGKEPANVPDGADAQRTLTGNGLDSQLAAYYRTFAKPAKTDKPAKDKPANRIFATNGEQVPANS